MSSSLIVAVWLWPRCATLAGTRFGPRGALTSARLSTDQMQQLPNAASFANSKYYKVYINLLIIIYYARPILISAPRPTFKKKLIRLYKLYRPNI